MKKIMNSKLSNWIFSILVLLFVVFMIKYFILDIRVISDSNMSPNLNNGDVVLINKLNKFTNYIKKTDVVEFTDEESNRYIARVIGMPKDSVEIINDDVFVNGNKIYEPYVFLQKSRNLNNKRWVLDSDEYFVIEDNRDSDNYSSSKYTGPINKKSITGVVFFKLFPIERIGSI